jgi:hypothetical protein
MFVHATLFKIDARALDDIGDDLLVYASDLVIRHLDGLFVAMVRL